MTATHSPDFTPIKNFFENMVMQVLTTPDNDPKQLEQIITMYTQMRIQECLLSDGFKEKVKSHHGHIYMKILREMIVDELKLTQPTEVKDLTMQELMKDN